MTLYLDMATIEAVHKALAIPLGGGGGGGGGGGRDQEDDVVSDDSSVGEEVED